jgi:hypothetical protein
MTYTVGSCNGAVHDITSNVYNRFFWAPSGPFSLDETIDLQIAMKELRTSMTQAAPHKNESVLGRALTLQEGAIHGIGGLYFAVYLMYVALNIL